MTTVSEKSFSNKPRIDAADKVRGLALFAADYVSDRMAHAALARSPIVKGTITSIDTKAAEGVKGVLLVLTHETVGKIEPPGYLFAGGTMYQSVQPMTSPQIAHRGQPIALVVAETLEAAIEASHLVKATYDVAAAVTTIDEKDAKPVDQSATAIAAYFPDPAWGDAEAAFNASKNKVDAEYFSPVQHHNPIELLSTVAEWKDDVLTIREGSQNAGGIRIGIAKQLGIDPGKIRVVSPFAGGAFGQKNALQAHTVFAAIAARTLGRPVKLVVPRAQIFHDASFRPANRHRIKLAANEKGHFTAAVHEAEAQTSRHDLMPAVFTDTTAHLYRYDNYRGVERLVPLDTQTPGFMRAPWEHPGSFALGCALDELAYKLAMDPVHVALANDTDKDMLSGLPHSSRYLSECIKQGAERFGWSRRRARPGSMKAKDGSLIGWGFAAGLYPGYSIPAVATVKVTDDGHAEVSSGVHEMGQGARSALASVVERVLDIPQDRIRVIVGETDATPQLLTAGSWGAAGTVPAVEEACMAVIQQLNAMGQGSVGDRTPADILKAKGQRDLSVRVRRKAPGQKDEIFDTVEQGIFAYAGPKYPEFVTYSYAAHFVEVRVEPNTRRVRVPRVVSVADCGRVISPTTAQSQLRGGVIWGIGAALREATETDPRYGGFLNTDIAEYVVPVNADIGDIDVSFVDEPDTTLNPSGVKGLGEVSMTGVAAAIANAVFHATGKRVRHLPIRIEDLL